MPYTRNCPCCSKLQTYASYTGLYTAIKENRVCKSCCQTGKTFSDEHRQKLSIQKFGKKHSIDIRLKNSLAQKKRYADPREKKKTSISTKLALRNPSIRKRHIEALIRTRWLGKTFDVGQIELLGKWNNLGFQFEPNFQVHSSDFLAYVDGYDPINKVVVEYDSPYHSKPSQKTKDYVRQIKIIDILKPKKFWRYDVTNKQWNNVLEVV